MIWHLHEILKPQRSQKILARAVLPTVSRVVAVSQASLDAVLALGAPSCRSLRIPNGIDLAQWDGGSDLEPSPDWRGRLGVTDANVVFATFSQLVHGKGLHVFVEAAHRVARDCPEARFWVVGQAYAGEAGYFTRLLELAPGGARPRGHHVRWTPARRALTHA